MEKITIEEIAELAKARNCQIVLIVPSLDPWIAKSTELLAALGKRCRRWATRYFSVGSKTKIHFCESPSDLKSIKYDTVIFWKVDEKTREEIYMPIISKRNPKIFQL